MAELGQETVELSMVIRRASQDAYQSLTQLVDHSKSTEQSDYEKKIGLLKFIHKTRQRMLRLNVLAKWCQQVPLVQQYQQLSSTLSSHDTCFTQTADSMFFMHEGLQQARAPHYDVASAIDILLTGSYKKLPKCIDEMGIQSALAGDERKSAIKKLDILLRSKLLEISLPREVSEVKVSDGTVLIRVDGEFKVLMTLGYRGHLSLWRILHLELLVGERSGLVKLEESRRYALGDDLERRMAVAENPFVVLYSILHELCVALIMDTVIRQVQGLRQGRWKDAIRFELISDGNIGQGGNVGSLQMGQDVEADSAALKTPGLKLLYWLDFDKNTGGSDPGCPFIKIEPGPDMQIKCIHSTFVIDPETGKEGEFSLDRGCIDVEKLLLRAISCNRYTRLLEVHKELLKNCHISQAADDVLLQCRGDTSDVEMKKKGNKSCSREYGGSEVLRVRAYGSSYITLGINIRIGRFCLEASRNIIAPSVLLECEDALNQKVITAAEVFMNLRSKSMLHLFASIGRFLGLQVYEQGLAAVKIPKIILNGSGLLLLGFPQCGSSYYLLLELDKDFKPLFSLLETQPDTGGRSNSGGESSRVIRFNKIDISQMQMLRDELNLSLLDWQKLVTTLSNVGGSNQNSEHGLLIENGLDASVQITGSPKSTFSSLADNVFELETGSFLPPLPAQNHLSSSGTIQVSNQWVKAGMTSPKWEGGLQLPQVNSFTKGPSGGSHLNHPLHQSSSLKLIQSSSVNSLSCSPGKNQSTQKLPTSKSDQDLASIRSPHLLEASSPMEDEQVRLLNESSKELVPGSRSSRLLSPLRSTAARVSASSARPSGFRVSPSVHVTDSRATGIGSLTTTSICQTPESGVSHNSSYNIVPKLDKNPRKRSLQDVLRLIPSLQGEEVGSAVRKRRKISDTAICHPPASQSVCSSDVMVKSEVVTYGSLLAEANKGNAPSGIYVTALLHVVKHCSLCIKHARLTSQMDALDIPSVEEVGLRSPSSNIWFRLPFARENSWKNICLRLGRPGSMYWDVKINDQHFRDLWELKKGSVNTPWGCGVRIATTSDVDSHIRYDPEGVVLSYRSVEADSIKNLVADLRRLSNARLFALGMRKLLGVRTDDKLEEINVATESKISAGPKGTLDVVDKMTELMRKSFRIEAVGLTSFWFSFGPAVVARFVVQWESGKEGCTMHVSPDQLWPHTKFLEDFIDGGEVASLLDCIRLTAGPLMALAGATRPARAGPASAAPTTFSGPSPVPKQNASLPSQGLLPSSSSTTQNNATPSTAASGNIIPTNSLGPLGSHSLHNAAMLAVSGRGGPGIVPSSLLPIDVSVVLRGPYWIRIIYRKNFSVDMRCFAGDQVWLQPAAPPREGRTAGGSLPCPQFRPFIMEHVAQELNGLEPTFTAGHSTAGQSTAGLSTAGPINANHPNPSMASNVANGNRLPGAVGTSRPTSVAGLSRMGNPLIASSNLAVMSSGLPIRRTPGTGVPIHVRGELNTAFIGLGDDGGYGGGWVPLVALKKVLRGILKYLGVLWLFAQLPDLLKDILGSILKENEGALLNLDQEQPALRFFVGGYVFAVSVHRVQLLLQVLSVKRFHHQQQQQQQGSTQEELSHSEISEICDYFSRRVASEPYDASRVASFITLLTLPISVLREFLKLIAWKKGLSQAQAGEMAPTQKPRIELCLENHTGLTMDDNSQSSSTSKSNIHYDRPHNSVDFALTVVLDPTHLPHINAAGGAAWLPYCVSVRLRYSFGESPRVSFLGMEGSHGGRACWFRTEDWEKSKQRVARTVEMNGSAGGDTTQGRLRLVADSVQRTLQLCLQGLRDGSGVPPNSVTT